MKKGCHNIKHRQSKVYDDDGQVEQDRGSPRRKRKKEREDKGRLGSQAALHRSESVSFLIDEIRELEERDEKMREEIREKFEKKEDLRRLVESEKRELAETEKVGRISVKLREGGMV